MRKARWISVAAVLAACTWPSVVHAAPDADGKSQVAVFRLHGPLLESPPEFDFGFQMEPTRTLYDLLERFRKAKKDDTVKAVVLMLDEPMLGWAQMQELRQALIELRAADKDVYCYLETTSPGLYQLATAASRICITPTGDIMLTGLYLEHAYLKGLLDKIGVEADIEHIGAYKGAGEPFTRAGPSEEAKEMLGWLTGDLFDQMVDTIAEGRQIPEAEARAAIDHGLFSAEEAREAKLVDEVLYAEAFTESLRDRYGDDVEFAHTYGAKKGPDVDFSSPFAIFKFLGEAMSKVKGKSQPSVAVIYVDGMIVTGKTERGLFGNSGLVGSTTIRRVIGKARDDDSIKAVVLRVDSPGGSAVASDIIWHATTLLDEEKPLVVSMGNVAASGGYYVSAGARAIFADPGTITGSIGVVGGKLITKGLWDWLGVTFHETTQGKNADLFNSNRRWNDEQRAMIHKYMQDVYEQFTDRVTSAREDKLKDALDNLAGGRVYTGRQAQANGLVDKLGGLQDAIKFAAAEANISDYEIRQFPEPENFMDLMLRSLTGEEEDEAGAGVAVSAGQRWAWTLKTPAVRDMLPLLEQVDPWRSRLVLRSLARIELLAREHTLLILPVEIAIR